VPPTYPNFSGAFQVLTTGDFFLAKASPQKKKKKLSACRGEGSAVGPLLAVLRCRCAALLVLVLMSALAMPNCGAQGAPTV
jgi:hypothetical protein